MRSHRVYDDVIVEKCGPGSYEAVLHQDGWYEVSASPGKPPRNATSDTGVAYVVRLYLEVQVRDDEVPVRLSR